LEFTQFGNLQDMGLAYLKIDSAIIRDIHTNSSNQNFVQSLCTLGHSLGIEMIAEGVMNEDEQKTLIKIGVDGLTGPRIT
jgi:EAL domain-containing protein (putative c-di-GMP-specific phosphodiesterase class I)